MDDITLSNAPQGNAEVQIISVPPDPKAAPGKKPPAPALYKPSSPLTLACFKGKQQVKVSDPQGLHGVASLWESS